MSLVEKDRFLVSIVFPLFVACNFPSTVSGNCDAVFSLFIYIYKTYTIRPLKHVLFRYNILLL